MIEARQREGSTTWNGLQGVLNQTCDKDLPHLIVNVETSHAATGDIEFTETIQQSLEQKKLLPQEHFVDSGFTTADCFSNAEPLVLSWSVR